MRSFYNGKRCVIEKRLGAVKWVHILDTALETSNDRVRQMVIESCIMLTKNSLQRCFNAGCVRDGV